MSETSPLTSNDQAVYVIPFTELRMKDVPSVGGKNASLGEMISQLQEKGVRVPGGFATTAQAYRDFLSHSANGDETLAKRIEKRLAGVDVSDVRALAMAGADIRQWIMDTPFQPRLEAELLEHYRKMVKASVGELSVAVRSSATAEDLQDASFAGQQETFLNVVGEENLLHAVKEVFASLYNDRAISYRQQRGFKHARSGALGRYPENGAFRSRVFRRHVYPRYGIRFSGRRFLTSSYGLGETVVPGLLSIRTNSTCTSRCWKKAKWRSSAVQSVPN